jgi:hypothetical protein
MTDAEQPQENNQDASETRGGFGELCDGRCKFSLGAFDLPPPGFAAIHHRVGLYIAPSTKP